MSKTSTLSIEISLNSLSSIHTSRRLADTIYSNLKLIESESLKTNCWHTFGIFFSHILRFKSSQILFFRTLIFDCRHFSRPTILKKKKSEIFGAFVPSSAFSDLWALNLQSCYLSSWKEIKETLIILELKQQHWKL